MSAFTALLESLQVPRSGVLYVQSSTDWLAKAGFAPADVLNGLREWVTREGTLVMPSYPCRTTHLDYLATSPTFDVRRTPAGIGLIPEVFRRTPGARRSLDPDFSIVADGPHAEEITSLELEEDPFGRGSTYERMIALSATLLGLGVSLNTNSFIHVIDSRFQDRYPRRPYGGTYDTTVIDSDGVRRLVRRRALQPEFQQCTKPSEVARRLDGQRDTLVTQVIGAAQFFRWRLLEWSQWCEAEATAASIAGRMPCWLQQL